MAPFGPLYFGQQTPRRAGPTIIGEAEGGMLVAGSKAQRSEPYRQRICRPRACVTGCELVLRLLDDFEMRTRARRFDFRFSVADFLLTCVSVVREDHALPCFSRIDAEN